MILNKIFLKKGLATITLLYTSLCAGQNTSIDYSVHKKVQQQTQQIFDSLVKIRRDFHMYPELSEEEKRTSKKISAYLLSLGLEVHTNIGGYGVVGILKTNKKGKKIAWRADIDALPSRTSEKVAFQSKNKGIKHACGHDVNATIGLGIANVLSNLKEHLSGTIYFIFQPSEENLKGAKSMIDDGLFQIINPDEIYASHISPMPEGIVATKAKWLYAGHKKVTVSLKKSNENQAIIEFIKKTLSDFQNVQPDSQFWDNRNLLNPNIGLGNPKTIYKNFITVNNNFDIEETDNKISISTIINSSNRQEIDSVFPILKQKISSSKYAENLIDIVFSNEYPTIDNNKDLTTKTINSLTAIYGSQSVNQLHGVIPDGRSDDFAYFQERIPSVYFLLGGSNFKKGIISMPHATTFSVDENCIKTGVNFFSSMIIERLKL
jgi:metal-dependent amidase/aminoacylase/carboxypeptidase family protein